MATWIYFQVACSLWLGCISNVGLRRLLNDFQRLPFNSRLRTVMAIVVYTTWSKNRIAQWARDFSRRHRFRKLHILLRRHLRYIARHVVHMQLIGISLTWHSIVAVNSSCLKFIVENFALLAGEHLGWNAHLTRGYINTVKITGERADRPRVKAYYSGGDNDYPLPG